MTDTATLLADARTARLAEIAATLSYLRDTFNCQLSDDAAWAKDDEWLDAHVRAHKAGKI
jgi:hypothetical protein